MATNYAFQLSDDNPFFMYPSDAVQNPRYRTKDVYEYWDYELIQPWEAQQAYLQPYLPTDPVCFQFKFAGELDYSNNAKPVRCYVKNGLGANLGTLTPQTTMLSGDVINGTQAITFQYTFAFSSLPGFVPGVYYVCLEIDHGPQGNTILLPWISGAMQVNNFHENTKAFEYSRFENTAKTVYEQLSPRFCFRCMADFGRVQPKSIETGFRDMGANWHITDAQTYTAFPITLGFVGGLPDWCTIFLNKMFACPRIKIDNKVYKKEEGANLEFQELTRNSKRIVRTVLVEGANGQGYLYTGGSIKIYTSPGGYPYAFPEIKLFNGAYNFKVSGAKVINSSADETALITTLNNAAVLEGLSGTFSFTSGVLNYQLAAGESLATVPVILMTKHIDVTINVQNVGDDMEYRFSGGSMVAEWEAGSANGYIAGAASVQAIYNYTTTGLKTVRLFHDNSNITFVKTGLANQVQWTAIGGEAAATLRTAIINNAVTPSFNTDWLFPANGSLQSLQWTNSGLTMDANSMFNNNGPFTKLRSLILTGNNLDTSDIESLWNDITSSFSSINYILSGVLLNVSGQAPPATFANPLNNTDYYDLTVNLGWNIITD